MASAGDELGPEPHDRWWLVALAAAAAVMVATALAWYRPAHVGTWIAILGGLTFSITLWFHPRGRYMRAASVCLMASVTAASMPSFALTIDTAWLRGSLGTETAPIVAVALLIAACFFGFLDLWSRRPAVSSTTNRNQLAVFGSNTHTIVHGNVYHGLTPEVVEKLMEKWQRAAEDVVQKEHEIRTLRAELSAAVATINVEASQGNEAAKIAIDEARRSGDAEKLQEVLVTLSDRLHPVLEGNVREFIKLSREIAALAFIRGDIEVAEQRLMMILHISPSDVDAWSRMGEIHLLRGEFDKAEASFGNLLKIAPTDEDVASVAFGNLGMVYRHQGKLDRAQEMHEKSLAISTKLGLEADIAASYEHLGVIASIKGEYERGEELELKAAELFEKVGRWNGVADALGNLSIIYRKQGKIEKALLMLRRSLDAEEKVGSVIGMLRSHSSLGQIQLQLGDGEQALQSFRTALALAEQIGSEAEVAMSLGNVGIAYVQQMKFDDAERVLVPSLKLSEKLGMMQAVAVQTSGLGRVELSRGNLRQAHQHFLRALEVYEEIGDANGENKTRQLLQALEHHLR